MLVSTHPPSQGIAGAAQLPPAPPLPLAEPLELLALVLLVPPEPTPAPPVPLAEPLELLALEVLVVPGLPPEPPLPEVSPTESGPRIAVHAAGASATAVAIRTTESRCFIRTSHVGRTYFATFITVPPTLFVQ